MKASQGQIDKIIFEGLACAIIHCDLFGAIKYIDGQLKGGEELLEHIPSWFANGELPLNLKQYYINKWLNPKAAAWLKQNGFNDYEYTDKILFNITNWEADCIIKILKLLRATSYRLWFSRIASGCLNDAAKFKAARYLITN